ncbi:hypothetical protein ANANG_G00195650 [Anguilla anguilla]|uniref:Uncharacterized protein n=1 Tax=Anguilla anguilla TaxID=7936 RepID=A0A9D3M5E9_ANGAN|nr:hypothetical protein ANANG_G00195650 [Anguilla anguilla]
MTLAHRANAAELDAVSRSARPRGSRPLPFAGLSLSACFGVDNRIFTWGNGSSGQLGNGERDMRDRPSEVFLPPGGSGADGGRAAEVAGVACGSRHTFIWTPSGEAFSFGNNFYAQLGHDFRKMDFKENQLVPHLFRNLPSQRITQVACGDRHTLFALEDGSVAVCG